MLNAGCLNILPKAMNKIGLRNKMYYIHIFEQYNINVILLAFPKSLLNQKWGEI